MLYSDQDPDYLGLNLSVLDKFLNKYFEISHYHFSNSFNYSISLAQPFRRFSIYPNLHSLHTPCCDMDAIKVEANSLTKFKATWRELYVDDIESLVRMGDKIHPDLPESEQVFAERVRLFSEGCLALVEGEGDELLGYVISHPIIHRQPPALDRLPEQIAFNADQHYIHDLAILPRF